MTIVYDKEGFLVDLDDWCPSVATTIAEEEGITLGPEHWAVIDVIRNYYSAFKLSPSTRVLVKVVGRELGADKAGSIYLMRLFTGKPAKIAAKIAGLPKPANCD